MLYRISTAICYAIFKIFFRLKIRGREAFNCGSPFILASNHLSHLDPPLMAVCSPYKVAFLAKEELFKNPIAIWYFKRVGVIPIKRGKADIANTRTALKTLKAKSLLIFPQGTRGGSFDELNLGVGFLAKRAKVPIIAAKITGTDKILPRGAKFLSPGRIEVTFKRVDNIKEDDIYETIAIKTAETIKNL